MFRSLRNRLRTLFERAYASDVAIGRKHRRLTPEARPQLDEYEGRYVALLEGRVIAAADTSTEIARYLREHNIKGARSVYVTPPSRSYKVGVG